VAIFGRNQVSSFLIAGLGEMPDSIIEGAALLCDLGVYPFIVPLRPIPGTRLESQSPPNPEAMIEIYQHASALLERSGLSWKNSMAGCVRCGACSGLPDFERG
jgi:biotin synthase-related radical SAM superfamily protein